MAKLNDSNLAGSSGKVGRLVVSNVHGYGFLKHRPGRRGSSGATPKQLLVQSRMSLAGNFMANYRPLACLYFGKRKGMNSPFNQAMKNVLTNFAVDYLTNSVIPNYAEIMITKGNLLGVYGPTATANVANQVTVSWIDNSNGSAARALDEAQVVLSVEGSFQTYFAADVATRATGTVDVLTPPEFSGKTVHAWMSFTDPTQMIACNSVYMGTVVLL